MRLVMTLLVRDEIDIVESMLEFHYESGVDHVIATDNGSRDGTLEVLRRFEDRGRLDLLHEPPSDFSQHRWVTRMANRAVEEHRADWVIHADADEFFISTGHRSLKDHLDLVSPDVAVLKVRRHDHVAHVRPGVRPPPAEMIYRKAVSTNLAGDPLPPKVVHRAIAGVRITQGNHEVVGDLHGRTECDDALAVHHFPLRSDSQFATKVRNAGSGYARNRELDPLTGFHKRYWYDLLERAELDNHYWTMCHYDERRLARELDEGTLVIDTTVADRLALVAGRGSHG